MIKQLQDIKPSNKYSPELLKAIKQLEELKKKELELSTNLRFINRDRSQDNNER